LDSYFFAHCGLENNDEIPALRKDVRDVVPKDLEGIEAVIHLAALCNDPLGDLNPDWTFDINHLASRRLATLARAAGVRRFLYASSCSMYGQSGDEMVAEDAPMRPLTTYAISKVRAEEDIGTLADGDFSPVFLRNATACGMSPRLRVDVLLNNLVCWAHTTHKIRIMSDGASWRPIVHVEDIAQAFAAALVAPRAAVHNQAFNVGSNDENYRVRELAEIVHEILPDCEIEYAMDGRPDPRSYRVNFDKLTRLLPAFAPKWNARRGAREVFAGVRDLALKLDDFGGRKFTRLAQFKYLLETRQLDSNLRWNQTSNVAYG
jgi:nucleoside-diphosphate-sugar epimerase